MYKVYKHTVPNGKVYIGITSYEPEVRWNGGKGYKNNPEFFNAILKYGWNNIKHEILYDDLTKEEAFKIEEEQIALHKSIDIQYGYNRLPAQGSAHKLVAQWALDGTLVCTFHSEKSAAQSVNRCPSSISSAIKREGICAGYLWSHSINYCPSFNKRKTIQPNHSYPKKDGIPVAQYDKDGNFIKRFASAKIASIETGINNGSICSCCKGQKGNNGIKVYTAGGFIWKYAL